MNTTLEKRESGQATPIRHLRPAYTIDENPDSFSVRVMMPGVNRKGLNVSLEKDSLTITGNRAASLPEGWRALRREIREGDFRLDLRLNVEVDGEKISASLEDGVLTLTVPKAEAIKPRTIPIE